MRRKKKSVWVYKDGKLIQVYGSIIDAIYDLHICYSSIRKSVEKGTYVKGYRFSDNEIEVFA